MTIIENLNMKKFTTFIQELKSQRATLYFQELYEQELKLKDSINNQLSNEQRALLTNRSRISNISDQQQNQQRQQYFFTDDDLDINDVMFKVQVTFKNMITSFQKAFDKLFDSTIENVVEEDKKKLYFQILDVKKLLNNETETNNQLRNQINQTKQECLQIQTKLNQQIQLYKSKYEQQQYECEAANTSQIQLKLHISTQNEEFQEQKCFLDNKIKQLQEQQVKLNKQLIEEKAILQQSQGETSQKFTSENQFILERLGETRKQSNQYQKQIMDLNQQNRDLAIQLQQTKLQLQNQQSNHVNQLKEQEDLIIFLKKHQQNDLLMDQTNEQIFMTKQWKERYTLLLNQYNELKVISNAQQQEIDGFVKLKQDLIIQRQQNEDKIKQYESKIKYSHLNNIYDQIDQKNKQLSQDELDQQLLQARIVESKEMSNQFFKQRMDQQNQEIKELRHQSQQQKQQLVSLSEQLLQKNLDLQEYEMQIQIMNQTRVADQEILFVSQRFLEQHALTGQELNSSTKSQQIKSKSKSFLKPVVEK